MRKALTDGQAMAVCAWYKGGMTIAALAAAYKVSGDTIHRTLIGWAVPRRRNIGGRPIRAGDRRFFSRIHDEHRAYWLGFLAADGCVDERSVRIGLSARDARHLYRFRRALGSSHSISDGRRATYLTIWSKAMARDLHVHGVGPGKTRTLKWPALRRDLVRHFLRGYVDGDGGFSVRPRRDCSKPRVTFYVTSTPRFLASCDHYLRKALKLRKRRQWRRHRRDPVATIYYAGRHQVLRIARLLYRDATICLPRKHRLIAPLLAAAGTRPAPPKLRKA